MESIISVPLGSNSILIRGISHFQQREHRTNVHNLSSFLVVGNSRHDNLCLEDGGVDCSLGRQDHVDIPVRLSHFPGLQFYHLCLKQDTSDQVEKPDQRGYQEEVWIKS